MATPKKAKKGARTPTSKAMSCPVMVVPILAPIMIHTAWVRVIMPELTKPTTMTVVAEEDWMTAVITAPTSTPRTRFAVSFSRMLFMRLPAAASKPELIICIPCRNSASPPRRLKILAILIKMLLFYLKIRKRHSLLFKLKSRSCLFAEPKGSLLPGRQHGFFFRSGVPHNSMVLSL